MAWEWSHTAEAYANAQARVQLLTKAELLTILREWTYDDRERAGRRASFRLPPGLRRLHRDTLADLVWERMEQHRTCTNGGHRAYCCPDGCHTVSFDPPIAD
jgi:hypothetical protein